jgi:ADP-ribose pyrophosphatase YjhB (NUDIX family)
MKISAGTAILYKNKILLGHPTNLPWVNSFSPPKGGVDEGENFLQAAIRETWEEVGIKIDESQIENVDSPIEFLYINKKGELFKKCYMFIVKISDLSEIGLQHETLDKSQLQATEIDWAGFMTKEEAFDKIFFRFQPLLNMI